MTVAELIAELSTYPGDLPVFMKSDPEGNRTHSVGDLGIFVGFRTMYGIQEQDAEELDEVDYADKDFVQALTIWPGYGENFDE